ncbi:hypothetical protein MRX96_004368 [Rhipicephalus microplus]
MGSSEDEEPEEAEKSKECLAAHGYTVGKTLGAGSYSTVKTTLTRGVQSPAERLFGFQLWTRLSTYFAEVNEAEEGRYRQRSYKL